MSIYFYLNSHETKYQIAITLGLYKMPVVEACKMQVSEQTVNKTVVHKVMCDNRQRIGNQRLKV